MNGLRIGSLFSGIGGLELGLEQAGIGHTVFHVEREPYAASILGKRWPGVPCFHDVREVGAGNLPACDVLVGGFPCQDVSNAGKRAGLDGERSGLWSEYARLIGELRPRLVIVENVAALLQRGIDRVLGDLAALGYDARWQVVSAASVGAWHQRDRLFIIAAPTGRLGTPIPDANCQREPQQEGGQSDQRGRPRDIRQEVPDASVAGLEGQGPGGPVANRGRAGFWEAEPPVGRVAHGVPSRVDRLKCLGNAVVPEVARSIGLAILERGWTR